MARGNAPFRSAWLKRTKRRGLSPLKNKTVFGVTDTTLETAMSLWFFPGNYLSAIESQDSISFTGTVDVLANLAITDTGIDTVSLLGTSPPADTLIDFSPLIIPFDGVNNGTTFTDGKGHALTAIGTAITSTTQSKWGGSSGYFDGSGLITSPNSADLDCNNVDFSIEFWVWLPTGSTGGQVIRYGKTTNFTNYGVKITTTGVINLTYGNAATSQSADLSNPAGIPRDQWVFVKVSRVGTAFQCWVNGASYYAAGTATINTSTIPAATLCIGNNQESTLPLTAYLDDLRITIGNARTATDTVVPSAAFQLIPFMMSGFLAVTESASDSSNMVGSIAENKISTVESSLDTCLILAYQTDALIANTQLLIHFDVGFTDEIGHALTVSGATTSSSVVKFGSTSGYFNGSSYLSSPNSSSLDIGAGVDFCIEVWVYLPTGSTGGQIIRYGKLTNFINWGIYLNTSGSIYFEIGNNSNYQTWNLSNPAGIARDQWVFVKVSKTGISLQCWVNGSTYYSSGTVVVDTGIIPGAYLSIGKDTESTRYFTGYIDDLRVTIGDSRSATNAVVPDYPFQNPLFDSIQGSFIAYESIDTAEFLGIVQISLNFDLIDSINDYFLSIGSSEITGSIAIIDNSLDTLNLQSIVLVSCLLNTIESYDILASTGTADVSGTFNAIDNKDNAAINVFVSGLLIGALSIIETSNDNLSSNGEVDIIGALSIIETSNDNLSSNGEVDIIGALSIIETSNDNLLSNGEVDIIGALSIIETSNDNLSIISAVTNSTQSLYDALIDNVVLLCQFNGIHGSTSITDIKGHSLTASNGAFISTDYAKWQASLFLDGINDAVTSPSATNLDITANVDFCIECWIYLPNGSSGGQIIRYGKATNYKNWGLLINAGGVLQFEFGSNTGGEIWTLSAPSGIPRNKWVFLKASKTGSTVQGWVDGSSYYSAGTTTINTGVIAGSTLFIGKTPESTLYFNGYIDDLRVTIGDSRSSTNTTVPTSAFPSIGMPTILGATITTISTDSLFAIGRGYTLNGSIHTTVSPQAQLHITRNYTIIGEINTHITLSATILRKGIVGSYVLDGYIQTTIQPLSTLAIRKNYTLVGHIDLNIIANSIMVLNIHYTMQGYTVTSVQINSPCIKRLANGINGRILTRIKALSNVSKELNIPASWLSRHYSCTLTGTPDIDLPISSLNANLTVSGISSLNVVINSNNLIDKIIARKSGYLIINRVHLYSDGNKQSRPFIKMPLSSLRTDNGPKAGETITLIGNKTIKQTTSKTVKITEAMYRSINNGIVRYRCAINDELSLGDQVVINNETIMVGKITYSINANNESMEIQEYQANSLNQGYAIGINSLAKQLRILYINKNNVNYDLWRTNSFLYNGIDNAGQYPLYYDQTGLLYYLSGIEGDSNIPVLLSDNITQAKINV